jgi:hypothetical protein
VDFEGSAIAVCRIVVQDRQYCPRQLFCLAYDLGMSNTKRMFDHEYSKAEAFEFLDMAIALGMINASTGQSWKSAAKKVLTRIEDSEDVRSVNVPAEAALITEEEGYALSPVTIRTYLSRTESLIKEFLKYREDPSGYRGVGEQFTGIDLPQDPDSPLQTGGLLANTDSRNVPNKLAGLLLGDRSRRYTFTSDSLTFGNTASKAGLTVPFPLRPEFTANVLIPRDLTKEEADRLCVFIQALAQTK